MPVQIARAHGESLAAKDIVSVERSVRRSESCRRFSASTASRSDESEITAARYRNIVRASKHVAAAFDPRSDNSVKIKRVIATRILLRAYALPEERDCYEFARQIQRTLQKPDDKPDRARLKRGGDGAEFPAQLETRLRQALLAGETCAPLSLSLSLSLSLWTMRISVLFVTGYSTAIRLLSRNVAVKH